jgi:hypothetical protein
MMACNCNPASALHRNYWVVQYARVPLPFRVIFAPERVAGCISLPLARWPSLQQGTGQKNGGYTLVTNPVSAKTVSERDLVLAFYNEQPLLAEDLGRVLTTLGRDYRRLTDGRTLLVASVESGSVIAVLRDAMSQVVPYISDAAAVAKGATAMLEFAKALREAIKKLRTKSKASLEDREAQVLKTVEEICKAAVKSKSQVEIKHKAKTGDSLEIRISPVEALEIREAAKQERAALRRLEKDGANPLLTSQQPLQLADRLAEAYGKGGLTSDVRSLIEAIVTALRDGGYGDALETVAVDLANRGMDDLAAFVRAEANKPRDLEPPIASG